MFVLHAHYELEMFSPLSFVFRVGCFSTPPFCLLSCVNSVCSLAESLSGCLVKLDVTYQGWPPPLTTFAAQVLSVAVKFVDEVCFFTKIKAILPKFWQSTIVICRCLCWIVWSVQVPILIKSLNYTILIKCCLRNLREVRFNLFAFICCRDWFDPVHRVYRLVNAERKKCFNDTFATYLTYVFYEVFKGGGVSNQQMYNFL